MHNLIKITFIVMIGLNLFSCEKEKKQDYYCFGTEEYKQKEKSLELNTDSAAIVFIEYYFKENPTKYKVNANLDLIYGDSYIFSDSFFLYDSKTEKYILRNSYWVNGKTKEIQKIDNEILENIIIKIPKKFYEKEYTK